MKSTIRPASRLALSLTVAASVASAPMLASAAPLEDQPGVGDPDAVAAAKHSGASLAAGGLFFSTFGMTLTAGSRLQASEGDPGAALGLAIGGLAMTSVGVGLIIPGMRRLKKTEAWLGRGGRRDRMAARAAARGWVVDTGAADMGEVAKGRRMFLGGLLSLGVSGALVGGGVIVAPASPRVGAGLSVTGLALLPLGIPLVTGGKRRLFTPERTAATARVLPTVMRTASGERAPAVAVTGRF